MQEAYWFSHPNDQGHARGPFTRAGLQQALANDLPKGGRVKMASPSSPPAPADAGWSDADTWLAQSEGQPQATKDDLPEAGAVPPPIRPRKLLPQLPFGRPKDRKTAFDTQRTRGPIEKLRLLLTVATLLAFGHATIDVVNVCLQFYEFYKRRFLFDGADFFSLFGSLLTPLSVGLSAFVLFRIGTISLDLKGKVRVTDKNLFPSSTKQRADG